MGHRSSGVVTCSFAISGGKGKAAIANHLHDRVDHVSVRQQLQQLAGEAAVPYGVEVKGHKDGGK